MNFVCSAKARNLDLSPILVFATDEETKELAEGLGLTAFFDKTVRSNLQMSLGNTTNTAAQILALFRTMVTLPRLLPDRMETELSLP